MLSKRDLLHQQHDSATAGSKNQLHYLLRSQRVTELSQLGRLIQSRRPVYAIQPRGLDGADVPFDSLAEMAGYYVDNIREIQPCGPYMMAGYSFGGVVAF